MTSETKVVIGVLVGCAVLIGLGGYFYAAKTVSPVDNTPIANASRLERDGAYEIKATGEEKLKVVEFADFQCPACAVAYPVMKKLQKEYGDRVTFVYRNFPLSSIHGNALISAQAAEAAGKQGKFYEMHDMLFENQADWSDLSNPIDVFAGYAKNIGLDVEKWKTDTYSAEVKSIISNDTNDGEAVGVVSTPTFFIGTDTTIRLASEQSLRQAIEDHLNRK